MSYLDPKKVPVPSQDSSNNNYLQDVIGNKTDTHDGDSIYAINETLLDHVHSESKVYPTLANGVTVTAAAGAWTLGSFAEIFPASTITSDFDIHYIGVENISANDVYELVLYSGPVASEIEIGRVRFAKNTNLEGTINQPFQTPIILANERIAAKLASQGGGSDTVTISIFYHTY